MGVQILALFGRLLVRSQIVWTFGDSIVENSVFWTQFGLKLSCIGIAASLRTWVTCAIFTFCQNLGALEHRKVMKYAKQVRGPIQELSTACKTSRIYSLDDVTT